MACSFSSACCFGLLAHPGQLLDLAAPSPLRSAAVIVERALPSASGVNVLSTNSWPSASPRSRSTYCTQRFQRGCSCLDAAQVLAVEIEVLVDERRREIGRAARAPGASAGRSSSRPGGAPCSSASSSLKNSGSVTLNVRQLGGPRRRRGSRPSRTTASAPAIALASSCGTACTGRAARRGSARPWRARSRSAITVRASALRPSGGVAQQLEHLLHVRDVSLRASPTISRRS